MGSNTEWAGKRVTVTGGTGFVGANLVRRLVAEGAEVHVLSRDPANAWRLAALAGRITMLQADLACREQVEKVLALTRPAVVFHLATARVSEMPENFPAFLSINTLGAYNVLTAARQAGAAMLVSAGSQLEYGSGQAPHRETDPLRPVTSHGLTKAAATMFLQAEAQKLAPAIVLLRLFHVYGPWESPKRLIPTALRAALNGTRLRTTPPGPRRDPVFVGDVVEAFLLAAARPDLSGEVFNIASGHQLANEEIVQMIGKVAGKPLAVDPGAYPPHANDATFRVGNIRKAREILGWQPQTSLEQGLRATMDWIAEYDRKRTGQ